MEATKEALKHEGGKLGGLTIELFADSADPSSINGLAEQGVIRGFTTNPTLMRKAGVTNYRDFGRQMLAAAVGLPVSFEVIADDENTIVAQAEELSSWGPEVYVKIPVTSTSGEPMTEAVRRLVSSNVRVNVTAVTLTDQVRGLRSALNPTLPAIISVFAGRIADSGRDPIPIVRECVELLADLPAVRVLWASPREVLNVLQAQGAGAHIITITPDLLSKLKLLGRDLRDVSLDTVRMFHADATAAGYLL